MDWKSLYPRSSKPRLPQVNAFLAAELRPLFAQFNQILKSEYGLGYVQIAYMQAKGWVYRYGHRD